MSEPFYVLTPALNEKSALPLAQFPFDLMRAIFFIGHIFMENTLKISTVLFNIACSKDSL